MKLRQIARTFQAVAALLALLATSVAGMAETLRAADLPGCCNSAYCPLHQMQKDKSLCDTPGKSSENGYSMRACEATPSPVLGTAPFVLLAPLAMRGPASA